MVEIPKKKIIKTGHVFSADCEVSSLRIDEHFISGVVYENGGGRPRVTWKHDGSPVTANDKLDMENITIDTQ